MVKTANEIWRDFVTDGVTASGVNEPAKADIREWGTSLEAFYNASGSALIFQSYSALSSDIAHDANTMAWVVNDTNISNNGIYQKQGASGTGSWILVADLPYSFVKASNVSAGTANAIKATTAIPVSSDTLVFVNITATNTASPPTISFNDATPLTIRTISGTVVPTSGLVAGTTIVGIPTGSDFQLITDDAIGSVIQVYLSQAISARDAALAAQNASETARDLSQQYSEQSGDYASQAQALVTEAEAGFAGFPSTAAYDFGFISDSTTYFNQNWGTIV